MPARVRGFHVSKVHCQKTEEADSENKIEEATEFAGHGYPFDDELIGTESEELRQ
jgi:hypothetical protein